LVNYDVMYAAIAP